MRLLNASKDLFAQKIGKVRGVRVSAVSAPKYSAHMNKYSDIRKCEFCVRCVFVCFLMFDNKQQLMALCNLTQSFFFLRHKLNFFVLFI